jgi:hypothetical protein
MTGMLEIARPSFLWAGVLLAGVPLILHLLQPRERKPRLLPTARFLTPDTRIRIRIHKLPDRLFLLALRMGLCLLLGAALAGLSWIGPSEGATPIIVAAMPPGPDSLAVEEHLARAHEVEAAQIVRVSADPGESIQLAHLLRALRDEAGHSTGADSLSARLVAHPDWEAWGPGTLELRDHLWPGRISLEVPARLGQDGPPASPPTIHLDADPDLVTPVTQALELLGLDVQTDAPSPIHLRVGGVDRLGDLWIHEPPGEGVPGHHFLLLDGRVIQGAGTFPGGTPAAGAKVSLLRVGGTPAAAARFHPEAESAVQCTVALPLAADAPVLDRGELPLLLDALLRESCPGALVLASEPGAEEAWRQLLEGSERPERVEAAPLRYEGAGFPLTRLLLALALAVAVGEMALIRRIDTT